MVIDVTMMLHMMPLKMIVPKQLILVQVAMNKKMINVQKL